MRKQKGPSQIHEWDNDRYIQSLQERCSLQHAHNIEQILILKKQQLVNGADAWLLTSGKMVLISEALSLHAFSAASSKSLGFSVYVSALWSLIISAAMTLVKRSHDTTISHDATINHDTNISHDTNVSHDTTISHDNNISHDTYISLSKPVSYSKYCVECCLPTYCTLHGHCLGST